MPPTLPAEKLLISLTPPMREFIAWQHAATGTPFSAVVRQAIVECPQYQKWEKHLRDSAAQAAADEKRRVAEAAAYDKRMLAEMRDAERAEEKQAKRAIAAANRARREEASERAQRKRDADALDDAEYAVLEAERDAIYADSSRTDLKPGVTNAMFSAYVDRSNQYYERRRQRRIAAGQPVEPRPTRRPRDHSMSCTCDDCYGLPTKCEHGRPTDALCESCYPEEAAQHRALMNELGIQQEGDAIDDALLAIARNEKEG